MIVDRVLSSELGKRVGGLKMENLWNVVQKYRSHRKHLLAREAEAASWSQKRQMYGGGGHKREMGGGWIPPTMGFPHVTPMHHHPFRPLHVWGHPTIDQSAMHMWPKHLPHSPSPSPDPYWHPHHQRVSSLFLILALFR